MIIVNTINGKTVNPLVSFGNDIDPRKNFSFGARKAGLILEAVETHGVDALLAMLRTVAGVPIVASPEQGVTPERADLATVATPSVVPVKATPVIGLDASKPIKTKSVPTDDTAERAILLGQIMASGVKWRFVAKNWKTEVLRSKVAALPIATTTPVIPVSASPIVAKPEATGPNIVHTDTIDGKTYVLLSTGETKLAYVVNGKTRYRKTDKAISKAPLTPVPAPTPVPVPVPHTAKVATIPFAVTVAKGENGITYVIMSDDTCRTIA